MSYLIPIVVSLTNSGLKETAHLHITHPNYMFSLDTDIPSQCTVNTDPDLLPPGPSDMSSEPGSHYQAE